MPTCSGRYWPSSPLLTRGADLARTHVCCLRFEAAERSGKPGADAGGVAGGGGGDGDGDGGGNGSAGSEGADAPVLSEAHREEIAKAERFRAGRLKC